jgi:hypothetical protein
LLLPVTFLALHLSYGLGCVWALWKIRRAR